MNLQINKNNKILNILTIKINIKNNLNSSNKFPI